MRVGERIRQHTANSVGAADNARAAPSRTCHAEARSACLIAVKSLSLQPNSPSAVSAAARTSGSESPSSALTVSAPPRSLAKPVAAAYWRFYTRNRVELTALRQAALVNAEFGAQIQQLMNRDINHLRDHLDPITAAGRTLPAPPELTLAMFAGLLDGFGSHWQMSQGRFGEYQVGDDEAIDALTDFVYRALNFGA